jgi:dTDP-4-dehydrorhamnose 3,5-epimerase
MKVKPTGIEDLMQIDPDVFRDERGFFLESYNSLCFNELGIKHDFVQDNHSRSHKGILRGLHYQVVSPQSQIVYVSQGKIFDVAVDLRPWSKTFKKWFGMELSGDNPQLLYMGPGLTHGFVVLSEIADVHYKVSRTYDPSDEGGLRWCDPEVAIDWPCKEPKVSSRDAKFPLLKDIPETKFPQMNK